MKIVITIFFTFLLTTANGQTEDYQLLLDRAKMLFKSGSNFNREEGGKFDYYQVVSILEKVLELNPNSAEARYFLGYAYSRINSWDGKSMMDMNVDLLYKTSEQFEKVIELTPKYTDEIILLDPYSKQTAEWGSMAMSYWYNNKADSAIWAFSEGKKRGGFSDFILGLNRNILDVCSKNSILISSGDNFSIPLWYLQIIEKYRTDVAVVDISLLNTNWYPAFLSKNKSVAFDLPDEALDTIDYTSWKDSIITINNFSWTLKPSYYDQYLLRGDRLFLSLLKENKFQRELYFTIGFIEGDRLSLKEYLSPHVIVDKLSISNKDLLSFKNYKKIISKNLSLSKHLNLNSPDEQRLFDVFRYNLLERVRKYLIDNEKENAKELLELLDKFADDGRYPYRDEELKEYVDYLKLQI